MAVAGKPGWETTLSAALTETDRPSKLQHFPHLFPPCLILSRFQKQKSYFQVTTDHNRMWYFQRMFEKFGIFWRRRAKTNRCYLSGFLYCDKMLLLQTVYIIFIVCQKYVSEDLCCPILREGGIYWLDVQKW